MPFDRKVDLCIVTTTESELESAKAVLKKRTGSLEGPLQCFFSGTEDLATMVFSTTWESDDRSLEVALVRAKEQRRDEAFALVERLSRTPLKPSVIAMVGVCAGNPTRGDIQLGDLLVPFTITLDSGKQHGDKPQGKAETLPLPLHKTFQEILASMTGNAEWVKYIPDEMKFDAAIDPSIALKKRPPVIHTGPFFTGDNLKANANWKEIAKRVDRKLTGYDMEGYGFLNGCQQYLPNSKRIFVKGVSDYASEKTKTADKSYQKYCCASATAFVLYLGESFKESLFGRGIELAKLVGQDEPDSGVASVGLLQEEIEEKHLKNVYRKIKSFWKRVARELCLTDDAIESCERSHTLDEERCYEILKEWKRKQKGKGKVWDLATAIYKADLEGIVKEIYGERILKALHSAN